ncbi:MAG: hypothetical protein PHP24_01350 [Acidithiobacillus sp.]|nr:hypothetical protein [Acidithiobacillus sp.]
MEFYAHRYVKLGKGGVLVVNMLNSAIKCAGYIARIRDRFDSHVIAIEAELFGDWIVVAYTGHSYFGPQDAVFINNH